MESKNDNCAFTHELDTYLAANQRSHCFACHYSVLISLSSGKTVSEEMEYPAWTKGMVAYTWSSTFFRSRQPLPYTGRIS